MADGPDHFLLLPYLEGMKAGFLQQRLPLRQESREIISSSETEDDRAPLVSESEPILPKKQRKWFQVIQRWLGFDTPHVNQLHRLKKEFSAINDRLTELLNINQVRTSFSEGSTHFMHEAIQKNWHADVKKSAEKLWKSLSKDSFFKQLWRGLTFWRKPNPDEFHERLEAIDNRFAAELTNKHQYNEDNLNLARRAFGYHLGQTIASAPKKANKWLSQLRESSRANSLASHSTPADSDSDHEELIEEQESRSESSGSTHAEVHTEGASVAVTIAAKVAKASVLEPDILEEPDLSFAQMHAEKKTELLQKLPVIEPVITKEEHIAVKSSDASEKKRSSEASTVGNADDVVEASSKAVNLSVVESEQLALVPVVQKQERLPVTETFAKVVRDKKVQMYDICLMLWSAKDEEARQAVIEQGKNIINELKREKKAIALQEHPDKVKDSPYGSYIGDVITLYREVEELISRTLTTVRGSDFTHYQARQKSEILYFNAEKADFLARFDGVDITFADLAEEIRLLGAEVAKLRAGILVVKAAVFVVKQQVAAVEQQVAAVKVEVASIREEFEGKLQEMQDQARADREEARRENEVFLEEARRENKVLLEEARREIEVFRGEAKRENEVFREEMRKEKDEFKEFIKALMEDWTQGHEEREQQDSRDKREVVAPATSDNAVEARNAIDLPVLANQKLTTAEKIAGEMVVRLFASIPKTGKPIIQSNLLEDQSLKIDGDSKQKSFSSSV